MAKQKRTTEFIQQGMLGLFETRWTGLFRLEAKKFGEGGVYATFELSRGMMRNLSIKLLICRLYSGTAADEISRGCDRGLRFRTDCACVSGAEAWTQNRKKRSFSAILSRHDPSLSEGEIRMRSVIPRMKMGEKFQSKIDSISKNFSWTRASKQMLSRYEKMKWLTCWTRLKEPPLAAFLVQSSQQFMNAQAFNLLLNSLQAPR